MSLETHFNNALEHLLSGDFSPTINADQLIQSIDLTLLEEHPSSESINNLLNLSTTNRIAAVCVFTKELHHFAPKNNFHLATVVNFPHGTSNGSEVLREIDQAIKLGVNEIDYVFPYQMYLRGNKQEALHQCSVISEYCKTHNIILKIILETGAFKDMRSIYEAGTELLTIGCNFLKTSTGKAPQGASFSAVFALLSAIKDSGKECGIKVSGGVKTARQALGYGSLAELLMEKKIEKNWFRLGASSLLNELMFLPRSVNSVMGIF